jgi:DNA-binding GntR family transcriptional regulator
MERMRRASGGQLVYTELRRRILDLELEPGQRLYEPELAAELQVSRTPLREALRLLLAEDLLDQLPTGGMVVRPLSRTEIHELYGVRAALEGLMASEAALAVDPAGLQALTLLVARNERLVEMPADAMNAGHEFHQRIAAIAGHSWASRMHAQIDGQMSRYRVFTNQTQGRRSAALAEHRGILQALADHDPDLAKSLAEAHVLSARDVALDAVEERLEAQAQSSR